ncbi:hypothetical protein [Paenibacillus alvei]|uniref:hypothetical protein n=1 Tax=Paenibacillus alvei TaxID=44250 RepID=UPI0018CCDC33|nr:hypothetical protein [Paenibacillus alvei]MBG9734637.1 hypothetical protein [Paenibacillus alvei]MBG9743052.1 hypothetical protein [Paenibacillus alvei]MCY9582072.1 hypothetical protein [Paenibacillus alvei]MCY9587698.1 hypothetical protein [Paenibacillus alvei]
MLHLPVQDKNSWDENSLFSKVKLLVDEWDPLGLRALGAPDDEYDCLTAYIVKLSDVRSDMKMMEEELEQCMEEHFGIGPSIMGEERLQRWRMSISMFCKRLDWLVQPVVQQYAEYYTST